MAISFQCQGCGKPYHVSEEFAGKLGQCKKCGAKMRIPRESASGPDPDDLGLERLAPKPKSTAPAQPLPRTTYRPAPASDAAERPKSKPKKTSKPRSGSLQGSGGYQGDHVRHLVWVVIVVAFFVFRVIVKTSMRNDMNAAAEQRQAQEPEQEQDQP